MTLTITPDDFCFARGLFHVKQCPENMDILDPRGEKQSDPESRKREQRRMRA
jgi:hypothetical protein